MKHAAVFLLAEPALCFPTAAPHSGEGECTAGEARKYGPNLSQQQLSVERETVSEQPSCISGSRAIGYTTLFLDPGLLAITKKPCISAVCGLCRRVN